VGGGRMSIGFWYSNKEVINGLKRAIDKIDEQDRTIKTLREKLRKKKEILKDELMVDYHQMEELKERYIDFYHQAPFHFTEEEKRDYDDFRDFHKSSNVRDEEGNPDVCYCANGILSSVIFHYHPEEFNLGTIIVECPHCHTKRELGTFTDILNENDSPKIVEDEDNVETQ
jgi:hypothetical protein